jgi:hypothetical protein
MTLLLLVGELGLLVLPACARPLGRRLPPAEWANLCAGLLAAGGLALETSLVIIGSPTVLRLAHLEAVLISASTCSGSLCRGALLSASRPPPLRCSSAWLPCGHWCAPVAAARRSGSSRASDGMAISAAMSWSSLPRGCPAVRRT